MERPRAALDALHWAYDTNETFRNALGQKICFVRARPHKLLSSLQDREVELEQSFRPHARILERFGSSPTPCSKHNIYDHIIYLGTKQKVENLWNIARLEKKLHPQGTLSFALENELGANSYRKKLSLVFGEVVSESKSKSRVFLLSKGNIADDALLESWLNLPEKRERDNAHYYSHPAAFSWDKIDTASKLLIQHLPSSLSGHGADLGAGYGYLAAESLKQSKNINGIDLYEAEYYALEASKKNLSRAQDIDLQFYWHDVCEGLFRQDYDWIISNPPIHREHQHSVELFESFIKESANGLHHEGLLFVVCQKQLPAPTLLEKYFQSSKSIAVSGAHTLYQAERPKKDLQRPIS